MKTIPCQDIHAKVSAKEPKPQKVMLMAIVGIVLAVSVSLKRNAGAANAVVQL